jgi:hypothetical protein
LADLIAFWCLEQSLDFAQITLGVVLVAEFVETTKFGSTQSDTFEVLVCSVFELMDGGYF